MLRVIIRLMSVSKERETQCSESYSKYCLIEYVIYMIVYKFSGLNNNFYWAIVNNRRKSYHNIYHKYEFLFNVKNCKQH